MLDELTSAAQRHTGSDEDLNDLELILESDLTTDEYFAQLATGEVLQGQDFRTTLLGGLVIGGLTLMFAGEILALVVGAVVVENLWSKHSKGTKALKEIKDGNFQPYLDEYDLRAYKRIVGGGGEGAIALNTTAEPLQDALRDGSISDDVPPCSTTWNDELWELWERIGEECPGIRPAIFAKVLIISGPQQTGKSSLASAIAYCRSVLLNTPTIAVTPHVDGRKIFGGLVVGAGQKFGEIEAWYEGMVEGFSMDADRRTIIIDEITQYAGDHEKLGQAIIRTALTESDKHGYSPILINHAQTVSAGFAGIKGVSTLIESSAAKIVRQYQRAGYGAQLRSPKITLALPGEEPIDVIIPDWMHLPKLEQSYGSAPGATVNHQQDDAPQWLEDELVQSSDLDAVGELNRLYGMDAEPNPFDAAFLLPLDDTDEGESSSHNLDSLPKELRAIADYAAKQNDWVKARDVRSGVRILKEGGVTTDQIRTWFLELSAQGFGDVDGEGIHLKYRF